MITVKQMLAELIAKGWSQSSIARSLDTTQPTVHRMINGSEPGYDLGKRVELMYQSEIKKAA